MDKFSVDDRVQFVRTNDEELDKQTGTVLGYFAFDPQDRPYGVIVLFDYGYTYHGRKAVVITEHCLEKYP